MKRLCSAILCSVLLAFGAGALQAKPDHVVIAYSASWLDGHYPPEGYNYEAFTHLARSFLIPNEDGSISMDAAFFDPGMARLAKAHGVKLLAALGGQSAGAKAWLTIARDPKARTRFFNELDKLVTTNRYDGVDVDWEPSSLTQPDTEAYTSFMVALRKRFPKWTITTALIVGDYWAKHVDWDQVVPQVDYISAMTYVFAGDWTGHSAHNANLYPPSAFSEADGLSVDGVLENLAQKYQVPRNKVLLGLHFDGERFSTDKMGQALDGKRRKDLGQVTVEEAQYYLKSGAYSSLWDQAAQVPYLERKSGGHSISYDNAQSIGLKCDYAKKKGYAGVLIWVLGDDAQGGGTPLLDAVARSFRSTPAGLPAGALAKQIRNRRGALAERRKKLAADCAELRAAGQAAEAQRLDPGPELAVAAASPSDLKGLRQELNGVEGALGQTLEKLFSAEQILEAMPAKEEKGLPLNAPGAELLVDTFESAGPANALGGSWESDFDKNNLGTTLKPVPFSPSPGGCPGSPGHRARISGHFGRSVDPWPYAYLLTTLAPGGQAVDLAAFKSVKFWAKGDGKTYECYVTRSLVKDFANFRAAFVAPKEWALVTLPLASFHQPKWGKKVEWKSADIKSMGFQIEASTANDEDYDLSIDQLSFSK